jgi:hypothetical protein
MAMKQGLGMIVTLAAAVLCNPAIAAPPPPGAPPVEAGKQVENVVTQPIADVNLQKKEIPPKLIEALQNPYSLEGIRRCREVIAEVEALNAVLGPDFDTPAEQTLGTKRRNSAMTVAGSLINGLIPFRSIIREVSGANRADQDYREAIYAGVVRRGFLKGYGKSRSCMAPGSPLPMPLQPPPMTSDERKR